MGLTGETTKRMVGWFGRPHRAGLDDGAGEEEMRPIAIVDIGSNSVRLVVYAGARRNPSIIYNEKVMAGLGRDLDRDGRLSEEAMTRAIAALDRFATLTDAMNAEAVICVATAAVRDARNGAEFAERVTDIGFDLEILTGDQEAEIAALGVLSAIPGAEGVVGDLGGGSLELARIAGGAVHQRISLPLGVLRIGAARERAPTKLTAHISTALDKAKWLGGKGCGRLYMVGGSWRAIARLDMYLRDYPLGLLHQYRMTPERLGDLAETLAGYSRDHLRSIPMLPGSRVDFLDDALLLLSETVRHMGASEIVISAYGLREGLLYRHLAAEERVADPLIAASRVHGRRLSRFGNDGDAMYHFLAPLFAEDPAEWQRLLHMACHLADSAWQASPDFRAERALEIALHGNWVGIDARGRLMVGQALYTSHGGGALPETDSPELLDEAAAGRAMQWGLAIRLAMRLGGGTDRGYEGGSLGVEKGALVLRLDTADRALLGEGVDKRLAKLAASLGLAHRSV